MSLITYATREDWLVARRNSIGSSDAPCLWGVGYSSQSPYVLWCDKALGQSWEPTKAELRRLRRGQILESYIKELAAEEIGMPLSVDPPNSFRTNERYSHLSASLDSWYCNSLDVTIPVELKSVGVHNSHEWDNDQCPMKYQVQLGHQLLVLDAPYGYVVGLCDDELFVRRIEREPEFDNAHFNLCFDFWQRVEDREAPEVDASEATTEALNRRFKKEKGPRIEVGEWIEEVTKELSGLEEVAESTKSLIDERKNRIREAIGDAEGCVSPNGVEWTWKTQDKKSYTVAASSSRILRRVGKRKA